MINIDSKTSKYEGRKLTFIKEEDFIDRHNSNSLDKE